VSGVGFSGNRGARTPSPAGEGVQLLRFLRSADQPAFSDVNERSQLAFALLITPATSAD